MIMIPKIKLPQWMDKYDALFYAGAIFITIAWIVLKLDAFWKLLSAGTYVGLSILRLIYGKNTLKGLLGAYDKFIVGFMAIIILAYLAAVTKRVDIAATLLIAAFGLALLYTTCSHLYALFEIDFKIKNFWIRLFLLFVLYAITSASIIISFGVLFIIVNGFDVGTLQWTSNKDTVTDLWGGVIHYSASMFYTNAVGDITPLGYSKLLSHIETGISYFFHIIGLGIIIPRLINKKEGRQEQ